MLSIYIFQKEYYRMFICVDFHKLLNYSNSSSPIKLDMYDINFGMFIAVVSNINYTRSQTSCLGVQ